MKKRLTIFAIMVASMFIGLPVDGFGSTHTAKNTTISGGSSPQVRLMIGQPRRRRMRRGVYWRNGVQYRNYGQFRRTQVGNRRFRVVPRYYRMDGRRYIRYQRIYY